MRFSELGSRALIRSAQPCAIGAALRSRLTVAVPFLGIGAAFTVLGASGRPAFLAVGLAFLALGIVLAVRRRHLVMPNDRAATSRFHRRET